MVYTTAPTQPSGTGAKSLHTKVFPLYTEYPEQPDPYYYHYPMYSTATPFPEVSFISLMAQILDSGSNVVKLTSMCTKPILVYGFA